MSKKCPKCGLFSPDIAERCDCGFDFLTKRMATSYVKPFDPTILAERGMTVSQVGIRNIRLGAVLSVVGLMGGITLWLSTDALSGGGLRVIWWGGVVAGVALLFRGYGQYSRGKQSIDQA